MSVQISLIIQNGLFNHVVRDEDVIVALETRLHAASGKEEGPRHLRRALGRARGLLNRKVDVFQVDRPALLCVQGRPAVFPGTGGTSPGDRRGVSVE